jgi:mono/diheme cytochrome c family protein
MRSERYQIALIIFGLLASALFSYFLYKELFPEYKIYQDNYITLEEFRSEYTGESPPDFKVGVKQIVFEGQDNGPAKIDRCTSCHVAVQLPHFSPTKIAHDLNGNIVRSVDGTPVQEPNENYIWEKLNKKIAELKDEKVNEHLTQAGQSAKVQVRLQQAQEYEALKTAKIGHNTYDVTKVLSMHPLIGKETRPFEFHPIDEYGCTSCHSGNGRGLTTEKAHGPVFDGQYEAEYMGFKPEFTERDPLNDPQFARVFNDKPGDALLFQTSPILVGNLIQSSCVQCHEQSASALQGLADTAGSLASQRLKKTNAIQEGYVGEKEALLALIELKQLIAENGLEKTITDLKKKAYDPKRLSIRREYYSQQVAFLEKLPAKDIAIRQKELLNSIEKQLVSMVGSAALVDELSKKIEKDPSLIAIDNFLNDNQQNESARGSLFEKLKAINLENALLKHIQQTQNSLLFTANDENTITAMTSDIDLLTKDYHRGQQLYLSQACYACHRIAGFARGGVGPELTQAGNSYPWYLKESIVWPQADLKTSTMPNFMLDHVELEDLMTFLLAQQGATKSVSQTEYKLAVQQWEAGRKMSWEKPIPPSDIHNIRYGMTVFATQGCAACHRLEGFESNVGYKVEKNEKPDFAAIYNEKEWFRRLFPEELIGSSIVSAIEKHAEDIDNRIIDNVRTDSILEELDTKYPEAIEALYSNFRFASRAKNQEYKEIIEKAKDSEKKKEAMNQLKSWQDRVHRVLMMYVQEYGLGRLIGPRPNWAGVYRSDEWLMEHFHNPASHVARSIMPILPFDDSKFHSLTYMLDVLGKRNRDQLRQIWDHKGFQPDTAFQLLCSQCHGEYLLGNGSVATWIYPIPKNLRNAEFLRNLTRENVIDSIKHGVKGTPMPPWGETPQPKPDYDGIPVLTHDEILKLVDWLYSSLPGGTIIRSTQDVPKWNYKPQDVIDELKHEGNVLKPEKENKVDEPELSLNDRELLSTKRLYYADLKPKPIIQQSQKDQDLTEIFDMRPNPMQDEEPFYYIKKKFYTKENIEKGQGFFELNCAVCHGTEADGSGIRASVMLDAKPRMLTNLDWIKTRDDMRLLRSIKYGVAGTAMTPWGDLTSSLQRLQLVIFIRTLSQEKEKRDNLLGVLYAAFDTDQIAVEGMRIVEYPKLASIQSEYTAIKSQLLALSTLAEDQEKVSRISLFQKQIDLEKKLDLVKQYDQLLINLKELIAKERDIYQTIGNDMISANVNDVIWQNILQIIALNNNQFMLQNGKLIMAANADRTTKLQAKADETAKILSGQQAVIEKEKAAVLGKFPSPERADEIKALQAKINALEKIKSKLLSGIQEDFLLKDQEKDLFNRFEKKNIN